MRHVGPLLVFCCVAFAPVAQERSLLEMAGDAGAATPVVERWLEVAKPVDSNRQRFAKFGASLAIDGDTAVVGAPGAGPSGAGVAFVFVKPSSGWATATETARLTASDGITSDSLGISVAIDGDTVVAGTLRIGSGGGAVYVFEKPATGWADATETAKLTRSVPATSGSFGLGLAIDGDTVVVGDRWTESPQSATETALRVFEKPASGWANASEVATLTASSGGVVNGDVGISGDTIVSGTFVFERPATGWVSGTETSILQNSDPTTAGVGPTAICGDTVVMLAAGRKPFGGQSPSGAIYVFEKPFPGVATPIAKLTISNPPTFSPPAFGLASDSPVGFRGDIIVAGTPSHGFPSQFRGTGVAYLYRKPPGGWVDATETTRLAASDGQRGDDFGSSVAVDGSTVIVGTDVASSVAFESGAAYVFSIPSSSPGCGLDPLRLAGSTRIGRRLNALLQCSGGTAGTVGILLGVPAPKPLGWSLAPCGDSATCLLACSPLFVLPGPGERITWEKEPALVGLEVCVQGLCSEAQCLRVTESVTFSLSG